MFLRSTRSPHNLCVLRVDSNGSDSLFLKLERLNPPLILGRRVVKQTNAWHFVIRYGDDYGYH